ncbi:hypothetical protein [Pseudodonghicola flavimaris]|uniref:Uncharacterized protein n=1 Tax=Pseudodonghicola flavimaris TaxID=3050036 RepID=A0ABT7F1Z4_9RHOB|nr:hypothetical protein [Pseudodonghicola flavimaris]MDK3018616.1 hypothetical protein [Pseudodonghicola flavimaris]
MQRILAVLMLVLAAWVSLPGSVRAHEPSHGTMPHASACPECPEMAAAPQQDMHRGGGHDCQHGAACIGFLLPAPDMTVAPARRVARLVQADQPRSLSSASVRQDLPPPRT